MKQQHLELRTKVISAKGWKNLFMLDLDGISAELSQLVEKAAKVSEDVIASLVLSICCICVDSFIDRI